MIFERTPSGVLFFGFINTSMTALTRTPQNTNYLQPSKFLLSFDRIPTCQYFCQSVNVPGISLGQAQMVSPMLDINAPGNKLTYNQLSINFPIDAEVLGWRELHDWFRSIASPEGFGERNRLSSQQTTHSAKKTGKYYSDATLTVLSSLNNPILRIQFINAFPVSLSDIMFDTRLSAEDVITCDATFQYDYFNFIPLE